MDIPEVVPCHLTIPTKEGMSDRHDCQTQNNGKNKNVYNNMDYTNL